jgi:hypothetical protein
MVGALPELLLKGTNMSLLLNGGSSPRTSFKGTDMSLKFL